MRLVLLWLSANYEQFISLHTQEDYLVHTHKMVSWFMFLKVLTGSYLFILEELITKKIVYHLFEVVVEFHRFVFLSYSLMNLAMCDFSYDALCTHWLSLKGVTL